MLENNSLVKIIPKFESNGKEYLVVINDLTFNELLFLNNVAESNSPFLLYVVLPCVGSVPLPVQLEKCDQFKNELLTETDLFKETNLYNESDFPWLNKIARFRPVVERCKAMISNKTLLNRIKCDDKSMVSMFSCSLHWLVRLSTNEAMLKVLKTSSHPLYSLPKNTLNLILEHVEILTAKQNQIGKYNITPIQFIPDVARNLCKELEYWTASFVKEYTQVNFFAVDNLKIDANVMDIIQQYALPFTTPLCLPLQCDCESECWTTPTPYFSKTQLDFAVKSKQDVKISWNTDKYKLKELLLPKEYIQWISERLKTETRNFEHIRFSSLWFPQEVFNLSPCNCVQCKEDIDSDDGDEDSDDSDENSDQSCNE